jgi:hypothetical protein
MRTSTDHSLFSWRGTGEEQGPFARSPTEFRHCKDFTVGKEHSLDFLMTNRGLRINLPLMSVEDGNFAAVLDCDSPSISKRCNLRYIVGFGAQKNFAGSTLVRSYLRQRPCTLNQPFHVLSAAIGR